MNLTKTFLAPAALALAAALPATAATTTDTKAHVSEFYGYINATPFGPAASDTGFDAYGVYISGDVYDPDALWFDLLVTTSTGDLAGEAFSCTFNGSDLISIIFNAPFGGKVATLATLAFATPPFSAPFRPRQRF